MDQLLMYVLQKIQKTLLQSDVQSKSDRSPVTVADYGLPLFIFLLFLKSACAMWLSTVL